jgi:hypothetical protein
LSIKRNQTKRQYPLSPPTTSRKTAKPSPMAATAAGTLEYLKAYGQGEGGGSVKEKAVRQLSRRKRWTS